MLLAIVLVMASLISYFYYLRVAWYMWFRDPTEGRSSQPSALAPAMTVALVVAAVGTVLLGVAPGVLLRAAENSAAGLLNIPAALMSMVE
jgi:NADH:ubiquinone oxidoreductase subunit 2 (subunit N)